MTVGTDYSVANVEASEHRDTETGKPLTQDVDHVPAAIDVADKILERTNGDNRDFIERSRAPKVSEMAVYLSDTDVAKVLDDDNGAVQIRQSCADPANKFAELSPD